MKAFVILALCLIIAGHAGANGGVSAGTFLSAERDLWQEKSFKGSTRYTFIPEDNAFSLKAHCDASASALYRNMKVDLTKTPILRWSWKIDNIHDGLDDVSKDGDDYAARAYVVYKGTMPWDVNAVDYVWANKQKQGTSWPNAYTKRAIMVAQKSGTPDDKDVWVDESRNVRQDFRLYFGRDITQIDGVAVMTDCDNGGGTATGYYRDIRFTAEE